MTDDVKPDMDIGREAVEHLAAEITAGCAAMDEHGEQRLDPLTASVAVDPMVLLHASAMLRSLRGALDAAEAERDRLRDALQRVIADFDQRMLLDHSASDVAEREVIAHARAALAQKEPPRE